METRTSVIIPVRNGAAYIENALKSALIQLGSEDECIVIDNASTDRSSEIVSAIKDSRIRLLHSSRLGPSSARNVGLRSATGNFIAFLDADDEWLPERHEKLLRHLTGSESLDAVFGGFVMKFELGAQSHAAFERFSEASVPSGFLATGLFRSEAVKRIGEFDEELKLAGDIDFYNRFEEAGLRSQRIDADVCVYRRHAGNITNDRAAAKRWFIEMLRRKLARARARHDIG